LSNRYGTLIKTHEDGGIPPTNRPTDVEVNVARASPVPVAVIVGLFDAFDVKESVALWLPPTIGVNVNVTI
jgi:hypothetical protein